MTTRTAVIEEAQRWLGAKWRHEARVRYVACDCGQLLLDVYRQCGLIPEISVEKYARQWSLHQKDERFLALLDAYAQRVSTPKPADIAVWKAAKTYSHAAIVLDWPRILHADVHEGVVPADASQGQLPTFPVKFYSVFAEGC